MRILFKYTSRSRPENFLRGLKSIIDNCESYNYHILCSFDIDDPNCLEYAERINFENLTYELGYSKNKIDAINRDMNLVGGWDILVNMSDDMVFTKKGFDNDIRGSFIEYDFDGEGEVSSRNLDQYIHFNDGNQKSNVSTMHIVGRTYYDRFKYIYHPSYQSVWCDVENDNVAKMLGKYKYMGDNNVIFRHLHPAWGLGVYDEQYRKTENPEVYRQDEQNYLKRKANGFN